MLSIKKNKPNSASRRFYLEEAVPEYGMAIHPSIRLRQPESGPLSPQQVREISAWTEQAVSALEDLDISLGDTSDRAAAGLAAGEPPSTSLTIPLDDPIPTGGRKFGSIVKVALNTADHEVERDSRHTYQRHSRVRRDSLNRREALLKGKEGSRRRQRWENGTLLITTDS